MTTPLELPRLRVTRALGAGGFGQVLEAIDEDGGLVAVKVAHARVDGAVERLEREARVLERVGPPWVPRYIGSGRAADDVAYLVMELVSAPTLRTLLKDQTQPMPTALFVGRALAIMRALEVLHQRGLVHRDLKPSNVFVVDAVPTLAKLFDFGLTRGAGAGARAMADGVTIVGQTPGTPEYMAPECFDARADDVDPRSDIYALGVVLFEMLTGSRPFSGAPAELALAHAVRRPPLASSVGDCSAAFDELIARCLAKEPADRFGSVGEARAALEAARQDADRRGSKRVTSARPGSPSESSAREVCALLFVVGRSREAVLAQVEARQLEVCFSRGERFVFVVRAGQNPVLEALRLGKVLIDSLTCLRARLHFAEVTRIESRGRVLYASPSFTAADAFPVEGPELVVSDEASGLVREDEVREARTGISRATRSASAPFAGPRDVVERLVAEFHRRVEGRGSPGALVVGGEGLGKTRTALEAAAAIGAASLYCPRADYASLLVLLARLERTLVDPDHRETRAEAPDVPLARSLAPLVPEGFGDDAWAAVAVAMAWLSPEHAAVAALRAVPFALHRIAQAALATALRLRLGEGPLALFIDDAGGLDEPSLDALCEVLGSPDPRLWLCLVTRTPPPRWADRPALAALTPLGVEPLADPALETLARGLLRPVESVAKAVLERLVSAAQGSPRVLAELIRGLKSTGGVRATSRGFEVVTDALEAPRRLPLIEWMAQRELERLPVELRAHAQLAALIGQELTVQDCRGVMARLSVDLADSRFPLDPGAALARLVERGVLVRRTSSERLRFQSEPVWRLLVQEASPALATEIHRAAYQHFKSAGARSSAQLQRLARHARGAGEEGEGAQLALTLAERLRARHAYLEAEAAYSDALARSDALRATQTLSAHRGRGLMRYRLGRYEAALADLTVARTLAQSLGLPRLEAQVLLEAATAYDWLNEYRASAELVERAEALLPPPRSGLEEVALRVARGRSALRTEDHASAVHFLSSGVDLAGELGGEAWEHEAVAMVMLAPLLAILGELDDAERLFERGLARCAARGDRLHQSALIQNRVLLGLARHDAKAVIADAERYLVLAKELGMLGPEYRAEQNLAEIYHQAGNAPLALVHVARAESLGRRLMGDRLRPEVTLLEARVALAGGDTVRAAELARALNDHQDRARREGPREALLLPSDEALLRMVTLATSPVFDEEGWEAVVAQALASQTQYDPLEILEGAVRALLTHGHEPRARALLDRARALSRERPNIMDARWERLSRAVSGSARVA